MFGCIYCAEKPNVKLCYLQQGEISNIKWEIMQIKNNNANKEADVSSGQKCHYIRVFLNRTINVIL